MSIISSLMRRIGGAIASTTSYLTFKPKSRMDEHEPRVLPPGRIVLIGYLRSDACGWILEYLFRDLIDSAGPLEGYLVTSAEKVKQRLEKPGLSDKTHVLCLFPGFLGDLIDAGISPNDISCFYTHTRIGGTFPIEHLRNIRYVLPMNSREQTYLRLSGCKNDRLILFPIGYDPNKFQVDKWDAEARNIDVLFCCRYIRSTDTHYWDRKNYRMMGELAALSADLGLKVCFAGREWPISKNQDKRICYLDPSHIELNDVYNRTKVLVNLSPLEGGPVSWIEAMACGCTTISFNTGFPAELNSSELGSYFLPIDSSLKDWLAEISEKVKTFKLCKEEHGKRMAYLKRCEFEHLSQKLHDELTSTKQQRWLAKQ